MEPEEIKRARQALGLTQQQAAQAVGVSRSTWLRWENGQMDPPGKLLDLACKQLKREGPKTVP